MILLPENITRADLVDRVTEIFDEKDKAALYELLMAYMMHRYPGAARSMKGEVRARAKKELDSICQIADELRLRGNLIAAKFAVDKGYADRIGVIREFYRLTVRYLP